MFGAGWLELLIVLVLVLLIFGPGRLGKTISELAKGIRALRNSLPSEEDPDSASDTNLKSQ